MLKSRTSSGDFTTPPRALADFFFLFCFVLFCFAFGHLQSQFGTQKRRYGKVLGKTHNELEMIIFASTIVYCVVVENYIGPIKLVPIQFCHLIRV